MTEAVFPVLGAAFVIVLVLPFVAFIAKAGLTLLERHELSGPLHGLNARYALLVCSSLLPLAWFLSAGLHQVESGQAALACILDHDAAARCFEPGFFAMVLGLFTMACAAFDSLSTGRFLAPGGTPDGPTSARVDRIVSTRPGLGRLLRAGVLVTDATGFAIGTIGWVRPRVLIGADFASRLSDDMLASALGHEAEHVRAFDPLRYLALRIALAVNPFGRWLLEPHVKRWRAAREAHCDREAVIEGASPLSLADAIVQASRPHRIKAVGLSGDDAPVLRFRIQMLLAFAESSPTRCCQRSSAAIPVAFFLLLLTLVLPHQTGTAALDSLHTGAEHALTFFLH